MTQARTTQVQIVYEGKDISKDLEPYLLSFTFTDNAKDKADDIALQLQDAKGEWLRDWLPAKSDTITASIIKYDGDSAVSLPCGSFSVDQIDYAFPPRVLSIKAVSSDIKKKAVTQKKTKAWEKMQVKEICASIASSNGLALMLDASGSYKVEREDQTQESDLEFLKRLCGNYGWSVKVQKDRLIIYDTEQYESASPALEISIDDARLLSVRFTSKSAKVYKKAKVKYHDSVKDEDYEGEYEDDSEEGSERELEIHERVESSGDAQRLAKQRLIESNRKEITGSISLMGDVNLAAGQTVTLSGFGMFSGKHFVNKATHRVDTSGYVTSLELGQPQSEKKAGKSRKSTRKSTKGTKGTGSGEVFYEGEKYYR